MSRDTNNYIIGFAGAVCIFWSVLVSGTALSLKEQQNENKKLDLKKNVVAVSGLVPCEDGTTEKENSEKYKDCKKKTLSATEVNEMFTKQDGDRIKTEYIELKSGKKLDPSEKDWEAEIKKDLKACTKLDKAKNKPQIKCHPTYEKIFNVYNGDTFDRVILPVEGKGLWSTMKGFISLASDGQTVKGLTFYSHGETPGLGGEIDNPSWKKQWINKKVYEVTGKDKRVALNVRKGGAKDADYDVDGLSGATLTSNGVTYLVEFWLGEDGYKPYLDSSGFKDASAGQATPKPQKQAPSPEVQPKEEQPETDQPENSEAEKSANSVEPSEENTQTTDKKPEENTQTTDKKEE